MEEKEFNPFLLAGYIDKDLFCDRENETNLLIDFLQNRTNITLFAPRRIGKTGLIHRVFEEFRTHNQAECLYIDILSTQNVKEFTNTLANAIYSKFPEKKGFGKNVFDFFKLMRPTLSFDELNGNPEISLDFKDVKQYPKTIQQIFEFLDNQNTKIIIAIDEFQQILAYPEKNMEAMLRTYIQNLKNINFVFCGSNQLIMNEIFNNSKRPFFASCTPMTLDKIPEQAYHDFIELQFQKRKKKITEDCIEFILEWTERHTYYTQYVCNRVFSNTKKATNLHQVHLVCEEVLKQNEGVYFQYRNLLTGPQWKLLKAFAKEGKVTQPHSSKFIQKHELGTSAMVKRGLDALVQKEMLCVTYLENGIEYAVYDKFLMRWMQGLP